MKETAFCKSLRWALIFRHVVMSEFIAERGLTGDEELGKARYLYSAYKVWADAEGMGV